MTARIKNREYNLRVSFDENGEAIIGFVHGFYTAGSNCIDIRPVPDSIVLLIAKKLGIEKSSRLLVVKRKARKIKEIPAQLIIESV